MKKIYRYNKAMGYVKLPLVSVGGVRGMAQFDNGNPMTGECPTCSISSPFWQMVIEETYCKSGIVKLIQSIPEDGDEDTATSKRQTKQYKSITEIDSIEKAIDYMANTFEIQVTSAAEAIREAHKQGIDFPNLKRK